MDGPNTNWNVLQMVDDNLIENGHQKTINIGSCKSGKFPLKFCETRWIEDQDVAERASEIWSSIVSAVKYLERLWKWKRPQNKSYETLVAHHQDLLIPAKLQFFIFIVGILKPYLVVFQTDSLMMPYMYDELGKILTRLLGLVFKLDEANNLRNTMKDEWLNNNENQLEEFRILSWVSNKGYSPESKCLHGKKPGHSVKNARHLYWRGCWSWEKGYSQNTDAQCILYQYISNYILMNMSSTTPTFSPAGW